MVRLAKASHPSAVMIDSSLKRPAMVALLGAESTGKTTLSLSLAQHLRESGRAVVVVPEVLREWCNEAGRTPSANEQRAIAEEQARRALAAADSLGVEVVIVDTTPLMTAIYSERLFQDSALYGFALAHHRIYHQTLVTGLDLPWISDGFQRHSPAVQAPVDTLIRHALTNAHIAFHVIYGTGLERLHHALRATGFGPTVAGNKSLALTSKNAAISIANDAVLTEKSSENAHRPARWVWPCDKCSDPDCEHRLFTRGLLG